MDKQGNKATSYLWAITFGLAISGIAIWGYTQTGIALPMPEPKAEGLVYEGQNVECYYDPSTHWTTCSDAVLDVVHCRYYHEAGSTFYNCKRD